MASCAPESRLPAARCAAWLAVIATAVGAGAAPALAARPADALWTQQWALQPGGPLDGQAAWALADSAKGAVVAVLDTGIDAGHPELRGALWTNPGEIANNGADDDANGWVDDIHGADFVRGDGAPDDEEGHGTHIAGLIAAAHDNAGIAGLAPGSGIMAVKVLDGARSGTASRAADGIRYALANGADVINVSVNGDTAGQALTDAVAAADAAGVPVVASAGNDGRDLDARPSYPASFDASTVLAVAGAGQDGLLASFSNFGARTVDVAAPGEEIVSTAPGRGYATRSGTSMAAPYASATLALMRGARPDLSGAQLVATLRATSARRSGLGGTLQAGQLDPAAALRAVLPADRVAAAAAATAGPSLTARVARRARRSSAARAPLRVLVTWRVVGRRAGIAAFKVTAGGGRTIATGGTHARGAWIQTRARRVRVTALDSARRPLASAVVRLR